MEGNFWAWDHLAGQLWPYLLHAGPPLQHWSMHKAPSTHILDPGTPEQVEVSGQGLRVSGGRDGAGLTESCPRSTCACPGTAQAQEGLRLVSSLRHCPWWACVWEAGWG